MNSTLKIGLGLGVLFLLFGKSKGASAEASEEGAKAEAGSTLLEAAKDPQAAIVTAVVKPKRPKAKSGGAGPAADPLLEADKLELAKLQIEIAALNEEIKAMNIALNSSKLAFAKNEKIREDIKNSNDLFKRDELRGQLDDRELSFEEMEALKDRILVKSTMWAQKTLDAKALEAVIGGR